MAFASPFFALILALSMLFTPMSGASTPLAAEIPMFAVTFDQGDDGSADFFASMTRDQHDNPVGALTTPDFSLFLNADQAIIQQGAESIATPTEELVALLYSITGCLPQPTEEDAEALAEAALSLFGRISPAAFTLAPTGNGFTVKVNLDQLCKDLDQAVPQLLSSASPALERVVRKYSTALTGRALSCAELAQLWPELELSEIETGFTAQVTMMQQNNGVVTLMGSAMDVTFVGKISPTGLDLRVNTPDGRSYQFSSDDLLTALQLLASVPAPSAAAFSITEGQDVNAFGQETSTRTISLDSRQLAAELNSGLAEVIRENADTVDALCDKYRSWFELIDPDFAAGLTADNLVAAFDGGLISLPMIQGQVVLAHDGKSCITIDGAATGFFGQATINGTLYSSRNTSSSVTVTVNYFREIVILTLNAAATRYGTQIAFNSTAPVFDLFRSASLTVENERDFALTTDTDVVHMVFDEDEERFDMKLGPVTMNVHADETDALYASLSTPVFYYELNQGEDWLRLDSTILGLHMNMLDNVTVIDGYFQPEEYDRYAFGATVHDNRHALQAYLTGDNMYYGVQIASGGVIIDLNGVSYLVVADDALDVVRISRNGTCLYTVTGQFSEDDTELKMVFHEGAEIDGPVAFSITIDKSPAPLDLPAITDSVDAQTFLMNLMELFE